MSALILAWLVGEGIVSYRAVTRFHRAPLPSELAVTSGFFVGCAMVAEANPTLGGLLAWGVDLAAVLSLFSSGGSPLQKGVVAANQTGANLA